MKNFSKFILTVLLFFALLIIADRMTFSIEKRLFSSKDHKLNYALNEESSSDILILGSSRANHHYVPQILSDSLGMSCVNLGTDGQGILYNYALFHLFTKDYTPKIVIYELWGFDWRDDGDANYSRLDALAPIYGVAPEVDSLIRQVSPHYATQITLFKSFRFNNRIHNAFIDVHHMASKNGYKPLYGERSGLPVNNDRSKSVPICEEKVRYLERLIEECNNYGIHLIFAASPDLQTWSNQTQDQVTDRLCKSGVPYLDYRTSLSGNELFKDDTHMNDKGAKWYSAQIASELKRIIQENKKNR